MPNAIGRWIISFVDSMVRLAALGFIWAALAFMFSPFTWGVTFVGFLILTVGFPIALLLSHFILQRKLLVADARQIQPPGMARQPVDNLSVRDLIALLDEDDLDDLRNEARETLRARIQRLSGDDAESFGDLLAGGSKAKRGR
jgi:hypothetical protein